MKGETIIQLSANAIFARRCNRFLHKLWKIPISSGARQRAPFAVARASDRQRNIQRLLQLPVLANPDGLGFYRVAYDSATLRNLAELFARLSPAQQVASCSATRSRSLKPAASRCRNTSTLLAAIPSGNGRGAKRTLLARDRSLEVSRHSRPRARPHMRVCKRPHVPCSHPALARLGLEIRNVLIAPDDLQPAQ